MQRQIMLLATLSLNMTSLEKKNHNTFTFKNLFTLKKKKKKKVNTLKATQSLIQKTPVKSLILKLIPPPIKNRYPSHPFKKRR